MRFMKTRRGLVLLGFIPLIGRFNLDDVGAHVAEILGAQGPGEHFGKVKHANSVQGRWIH